MSDVQESCPRCDRMKASTASAHAKYHKQEASAANARTVAERWRAAAKARGQIINELKRSLFYARREVDGLRGAPHTRRTSGRGKPMTLTPNAVERCKAVPKHARLELHFAGFVNDNIINNLYRPVSLATLWSAFDALLAENARMRPVFEAALNEMRVREHESEDIADDISLEAFDKYEAAQKALDDAVRAALPEKDSPHA